MSNGRSAGGFRVPVLDFLPDISHVEKTNIHENFKRVISSWEREFLMLSV